MCGRVGRAGCSNFLPPADFTVLGGNHDFAGNAAESELSFVVEKRQPLLVALLPVGDVGDNVVPPGVAENGAQSVKRFQVGAYLLNRHHIEVVDDLREVEKSLGAPFAISR